MLTGVVRRRRPRRGRRGGSGAAPRRCASASTSGSSPARSTSTCPAARRSATRRCSSACCAPKIAILDELDSGLDVDALRACARRVEAATNEGNLGVLAITHYSRLLTELKPDVVHVLVKGRIRATGGPELADQLEDTGYGAWLDEGDELEVDGARDAASRPPDPRDDPFGPGPFEV